jgi:hypothetical protein
MPGIRSRVPYESPTSKCVACLSLFQSEDRYGKIRPPASHRVSAKYLQAYLNEFVFRFNNRHNPHMFESIVGAC